MLQEISTITALIFSHCYIFYIDVEGIILSSRSGKCNNLVKLVRSVIVVAIVHHRRLIQNQAN